MLAGDQSISTRQKSIPAIRRIRGWPSKMRRNPAVSGIHSSSPRRNSDPPMKRLAVEHELPFQYLSQRVTAPRAFATRNGVRGDRIARKMHPCLASSKRTSGPFHRTGSWVPNVAPPWSGHWLSTFLNSCGCRPGHRGRVRKPPGGSQLLASSVSRIDVSAC